MFALISFVIAVVRRFALIFFAFEPLVGIDGLVGFIGVQLGGAKPLFLGGMFRFLAKKRVTVGLRNLIIIRVDFAEGRKPWRFPP